MTDPRSLGCLCSLCPLNGKPSVVPPQIVKPKRKPLVIVSEYPGDEEVKRQQFFVGPTGDMIKRRIMGPVGIDPSKVHVTLAVLCRNGQSLPPEEETKAVECCRPRLHKELQAVAPKAVLAAGKKSLQSLTGKSKLSDVRGSLIQGATFTEKVQTGVKVLKSGLNKGQERPVYETKTSFDFSAFTVIPTDQPARLFRDKWQELPVFRAHFQRAWLLSQDQLEPWSWGELVTETKPARMKAALRNILATPGVISVDIETTGIEPWSVDITRIGVASERVSVTVPWIGYKGPGDVYVSAASDAIKSLVLKLLASTQHTKVFQNGIFDRSVFHFQGIKCLPPFWDCLHAHMLYSPGTPHDLAYQASQEFPVPGWKSIYRAGKKEMEK